MKRQRIYWKDWGIDNMEDKKRILVINGPNINMLGIREPDIYGRETYEDLLELIRATGEEAGVLTEEFQSNHEGDLVDRIQDAYGRFQGIVINPGAYTHTSIAILDALKREDIMASENKKSNYSPPQGILRNLKLQLYTALTPYILVENLFPSGQGQGI